MVAGRGTRFGIDTRCCLLDRVVGGGSDLVHHQSWRRARRARGSSSKLVLAGTDPHRSTGHRGSELVRLETVLARSRDRFNLSAGCGDRCCTFAFVDGALSCGHIRFRDKARSH